jgi:hypothetical protein
VRWAAFNEESFEEDCQGLPDEALMALEREIELLEANPQSGEQNPMRAWEYSATFGEDSEGILTYWLSDDDKQIWLTHVAWLP